MPRASSASGMTAFGVAMLLAVVVAILLVILTVWRLVLDVLLLQDLRLLPDSSR